MGLVEIYTTVVPAGKEQLACYPIRELRGYAKSLNVDPVPKKKPDLVAAIHATGRATLCASLGT